MALAKRIIPCLDVDNGRVVKGVQFVEIRDAGDPVEVARRYDEQGADEITFLDITASSDGRETMVHVVEQVAGQVFIPLTVGGGIRTVDDMRRMLVAGADKISINTAAVNDPQLVREAAERFGEGMRFRSLTAEQQHAICDDICFVPNASEGHEVGARFFDRVRDLTSTAFWTTTRRTWMPS